MYAPIHPLGFPGGSDSQESACSAGDLGSTPGSGRSLGEGNDNPLQYSCLENSMDRGAWWATVYGVAKRWTPVSNSHFSLHCFSFMYHTTTDSKTSHTHTHARTHTHSPALTLAATQLCLCFQASVQDLCTNVPHSYPPHTYIHTAWASTHRWFKTSGVPW